MSSRPAVGGEEEIVERKSGESARQSPPAGGIGRNQSPGNESSGSKGRPELSEEKLLSEQLSQNLERLSAICHLGIFSIVGVLIRFSLEFLFGPGRGEVTDDMQVAFLDLPANVLGCFLMGMLGITLKPYVMHFSGMLSLGLTTGLMGSITTYASWNQRMIAILAKGLWVRAFAGYFFGMAAAEMALVVGADTGLAILWTAGWLSRKSSERGYSVFSKVPMRDNIQRKRWSLGLSAVVFGLLFWPVAVVGAMIDKQHTVRRHLWLACVVAPFGVWTRWYLAKLNGQGFGAKMKLAWFPLGTYLANMMACYVEGIISVIVLAVQAEEAKLLLGSFQLGVLGCLSTVSTFALEAHNLHRGGSIGKSYAYVLFTMGSSFVGTLLLYALPVWLLGYDSKYNNLSDLWQPSQVPSPR